MTDRGRVPFALVGVLLLVASGTVAVSQHEPAVGEPTVDRAMDRLTAESHSALRAAVREAAHDAARRPVLRPADTEVGATLSDARTFEDALELRIYLAARSNLGQLSERRHGVNVSASLPPIENETDVPAALERVSLERAGPDGRRLRVAIQGLQLLAHRDGRLAGETRVDPELVVDTPVLVAHDRVDRFDRRLNAYVGEPGLASRLTATLYPIAWARGYAQFGGQPIENVVANRHVALTANGAVLGEQRAIFGASDPVGRRVYAETLADTAVSDLVAGTDSRTLDRLDRYRDTVGLNRTGDERLARLEPEAGAPDPSETVTVDVGETADLAYLRSLRTLDETLNATYEPRVRVRAEVRTTDRQTLDAHRPIVVGTLADEWTVNDTTVLNRSGSPPPSADGWHRLAGFSRTVIVEERTVRKWEVPINRTTTTSGTDRVRKTVDLVVEGDHVVGPAPDGPIASVHERGGPFDGPNLVNARTRLLEAAVASAGGADELAARAAVDQLGSSPRRVQAPRPAELADWARPDLSRLRREVRGISVEVSRGEVASFRANAARLLADQLRDRRAELVDAPHTYDSVAHRARVGVRAAYVDRVLDQLERRASGHDRGRERLEERLETTTDDARDVLSDAYGARGRAPRGPQSEGPRMVVDAAPSYLTVEPVGHDTVPAVPANTTEHPLVVRNLNGFGLPTTGVVEALFGLLDGPEKTSLRSAAQVLAVATDRDLRQQSSFSSAGALRDDVETAEAWTRHAYERVLARHDLGDDDDRSDAVSVALAQWDGTHERAAALANGSAAAAVHREALDRWPTRLRETYERDLLAIELRFAAREMQSADGVRPNLGPVEGTADRLRGQLGYADGAAGKVASSLEQRQAAAMAARLPAGVPVLPAPGTWYATVNVWQVQVRGTYARFAVRVRRGAPDRSPPDLTYVRENRTVRLDVDGDDRLETVGYNRRLSFGAETVVGVAVPPAPQGVGDVGERDERSAGWPDPGPVPDEDTGSR